VTRLGALGRQVRDILWLTAVSLWRGFLGFYNRDDLTHAASIAYYSLLSLFPFFLLGLAILGGTTADEQKRATVLVFVLRYFPTQFDFFTNQLDSFRSGQLTLGIAGTFTLIWGALGVFGAISTAVNYAWGVEKQRSFWKHKLFSFLMLTVAGLMFAVALLLISAYHIVGASWFASVLANFPALTVLRSVTVQNATTLMFILVVGMIFYFVPNAKVRFRDVWIGAVITGVLWKGAFEGFSWWVRDMTRFTRINGSIAAVILFLIWVYVQAVILLYGVEFTAAYARLRRGRPEQVPAAPSPRTGI
jgi:membrane protein